MAVTLEELMEYSLKDFLSDEMYEDNLEVYMEKISESMATLDIREEKAEPEDEKSVGEKPKK